MKMIHKVINLMILLTFFIEDSKQVSVIVKSTHFIGSMKIVDGKQVNVFLGIPYAQPPIGSLRFKKPLPVEPKKTVDATEWRSACYQNDLFKEILINKKVSEDCLYLNIWSPKNDSERNYEIDPLRPVMFWIHGGAFISDSSNRELYDSEFLAAKGDIVVVSVNYRIDIFGFLYTGTDEAPGNIGLWDQALAMEWVIDNIAYFGGDPKQITIIGQNAGAFSVGVHLLSPISRNFFKNAIMISGSALNHLVEENPELVKKKWLKGAKSIGCGDGEKWTTEVIACLRRADADKLIKLSQTSIVGKNEEEITPQVIYGDSFLPEEPIKMLSNGDHRKNINLFIGTTDDEGGLMLPMIDLIKYSLTSPKDITKEEAYEELKRFSAQLVSKKPIKGEEISKHYISALPSDDHNLIRRSIGIALGDFYITCPTIQFAKSMFKNDVNKIKVYQYFWTRKINDNMIPCAEWMGACHGSDTSMLFGMPFLKRDLYNDEDRDVSLKIIKTFSQFAYKGQPLAQENKEWPNYGMKDNEIVAPYYEFFNNNKSKKRIYGMNLKDNECNTIWNKYIMS